LAETIRSLRNDLGGFEETDRSRLVAGVQCQRSRALVTTAPGSEDHQSGPSRIAGLRRSARCTGSSTSGGSLSFNPEPAAGRANGVDLPTGSSEDSGRRLHDGERNKSGAGDDHAASSCAAQCQTGRSTPTTASAKGGIVSAGEEPARPRSQGDCNHEAGGGQSWACR
jgi:hypothetical protein